MDFDLTKEQKMIRDEVRNFARKEIAPRAEEFERTGEYPYEIMEKMDRNTPMASRVTTPSKGSIAGSSWKLEAIKFAINC